MGCCESTARVDPGQQDNGFQSMGPRPVDVTPHEASSSQVPTRDGDGIHSPPPSEGHVVTSLPVIVEQPPSASPGSDISPGTTTTAVKTEAGGSHAPQPIGEETSLEPVMESPPKSETKSKDSSRSSSSSSDSRRKK